MSYFKKSVLKTGSIAVLVLLFLTFSFISTNQSASACSIQLKRNFIESESTIQYHQDGSISGNVLVDEALKNYVYLVIEYPSEMEKSHFVLDTEKAQIKKTVLAKPTYHFNDEVFEVNLYEFSFHFTADELNLSDGAYQAKIVASNKDLYIDKTNPFFPWDMYNCGLFSNQTEPTAITVANNGWETKYDVLSNKTWTVKFTQDIDAASINKENVKVYEKSSGMPVETEVTVAGKSIMVKPLEKYKAGNSYILEIQNTIRSENGTLLNKGAKMEFVIQNNEEQLVQFKDQSLENAIRQTLNKPVDPITKEDLLSIKILTVSDRNIQDISGLEHATNLTYLNISGNQIQDLTPLKDLSNLAYLNVSENQLKHLEPLKQLTNLTELHLGANQIDELSPLKELTKLTTLELWGNQISDLTPLSNLEALETLNLHDNQVKDSSPLSNLIDLRILLLSENQIMQIDALASLQKLEELDLANNQIINLNGLESLTKLKFIRLENNQLSELISFDTMSELRYLNVDNNPLYISASPIIEALKERDVTVIFNTGFAEDEEVIQIPDAILEQAIRKALNKPAGDITKTDMLKLTELKVNSESDDLDPNKELKNLAGIEYASNLTKLHIDNVNRVDLNVLQSLEQLQELAITRSKNTKFEPIGNLVQLKKLTLWRSAVKDITLVKNLRNLEYLELEYNEIEDITPIEGLTNLTRLNLRSNQVSDISSLRYLTNLTHLVLYTNQITDISVLTELPSLESIGLYENPINHDGVAVIQQLKDKGVGGYYSDLVGYPTLK